MTQAQVIFSTKEKEIFKEIAEKILQRGGNRFSEDVIAQAMALKVSQVKSHLPEKKVLHEFEVEDAFGPVTFYVGYWHKKSTDFSSTVLFYLYI